MKNQLTYTTWQFAVLLTLGIVPQPELMAQSGKPEELVNAVGYSVPTSPAFELLPNKPSEVSNLVTPKDILAIVPTFVHKGKVKTGVAADVRPFSYLVGSLAKYQKSPVSRVFWRTVVSVGTAPDPNQNNDAFLSTGIRMTLIDRGDPRANKVYTDSLAGAYARSLVRQGPPPFGITPEQQQARHEAAIKAADSLRSKFIKDCWNKFRLDIGYGYMARALNSSYHSDSLKGNRWGFWMALGGGIGKKDTWFRDNVQWNGTVKVTRIISTPTEKSETGRYVAGGRARFFISPKVAFSVETAQIWSEYRKATNLNETWTHFAAIAEINIPALGGWLTLGYGGDTAHRTAADSKFSFSYAVATNRIIKP